MDSSQTSTKTCDFVISRTFAAPIDRVFAAWTEADRLTQWWGPVGLPLTVVKLEFKVGGVFHYSMTLPDGNKMWGKFIYREIDAPHKIVFDNGFSDEKEGISRHPMAPTWPAEVHNVLTFEASADKKSTTVKLVGTPLTDDQTEIKTFADGTESMQKGFGGTFDQLDAYLAKSAQ